MVFILSLGVAFLFLLRGASASALTRVVFATWFVATIGGLGAVIEGRSWAKWVEATRIVATQLVIYYVLAS